MDFFEIGKIVNTHGIKGEVRVIVTTDFKEKRFKVGNVVWAFSPRFTDGKKLVIRTVRNHKQFTLVGFEDLNDLTAVESLKGSTLKVAADERHQLEAGQFYYSDIIGLDVVDEADNRIGIIKEILSPGANDVWVVKRKNQKDLLLPAIKSVILMIEIVKNRVVVSVPEGLDD